MSTGSGSSDSASHHFSAANRASSAVSYWFWASDMKLVTEFFGPLTSTFLPSSFMIYHLLSSGLNMRPSSGIGLSLRLGTPVLPLCTPASRATLPSERSWLKVAKRFSAKKVANCWRTALKSVVSHLLGTAPSGSSTRGPRPVSCICQSSTLPVFALGTTTPPSSTLVEVGSTKANSPFASCENHLCQLPLESLM